MRPLFALLVAPWCLYASVSVVPEDAADLVQQFAASELRRYFEKASGEATVIIHLKRAATGVAADGFRLRCTGKAIEIEGGNSRGILYGSYALVERFGGRWFFRGKEFEVAPNRVLNAKDRFTIAESPAIERRILYYWPNNYDSIADWIDFAAKARLNVFSMLYGWPALEWYTSQRARIMEECRKRGMEIEIGGHLQSIFLPRSLFTGHPDWFRMNTAGKRTPDWNLNPFNPDALLTLSAAATKYFARTPEATLLHAWADDIDGGGWSSEPGKQDYTPTDQSLLVANRIITDLRKQVPAAHLAFLAYHDTVVPPKVVRPAPGIVYFYAPRERCYAHALDDDSCALNRQYRQAFEGGVPVFGRQNTEIFEYYVDHVLFENMADPPLGPVLTRDASYYSRLGIQAVGSLAVNTAEFVTPPLNLYLFPKALWNPSRDLDRDVAEYAQRWFHDARMTRYFEALGEGMRLLIATCEYQRPGDGWDHIQPDKEPAEAVEPHVRRMEQALTGPLSRAEIELTAAISKARSPHTRKRLLAEKQSLDFTLLQGRLYYHALKGHWLLAVHAAKKDPDSSFAALAEWPLTRESANRLRKFVATSGLRGDVLMPDPEILGRRVRSVARAEGYTIDPLGQLLPEGITGYTISGAHGCRAVLWRDFPGKTVMPGDLDVRDEFDTPTASRSPNRWPLLVHSELPADRLVESFLSN